MERQAANLSYGEVNVRVDKKWVGSATVVIEMSNATFDEFIVNTARKRGIARTQLVAEAIRIERLWSENYDNPESGLYLKEPGNLPRRLLRV